MTGRAISVSSGTSSSARSSSPRATAFRASTSTCCRPKFSTIRARWAGRRTPWRSWAAPCSLLLRREGASQLVYKHSISTIMPSEPPPDFVATKPPADGAKAALQDLFLAAAARDTERMTLFLVNGVMLQGNVTGFDQFSLVLERGGQIQLVYKHALSTLQPAHPLDLEAEPSG